MVALPKRTEVGVPVRTGTPVSEETRESQTVEATTGSVATSWRDRLEERIGPLVVWRLTAAIAAAAAAASWFAVRVEPLGAPSHLAWWALAPLFYLGEVTVVHLRFRQNAHSFSMSEIPLVLGLFLSSPIELIIGQLIGNAAALIITRRQSPVKVAFNLSQFTLVAALALLIFNGLVRLGDPLGPAGWIATIAAVWATLLVADLLINVVIHLTGGKLDRRQSIEVIQLSVVAGSINTALGLIAVFVLWSAPQAAWLGLVPPAVVYLGYRAVAMQRIERKRLEAMYEATRELHQAPLIDKAVEIAAFHAAKMLEAEFAEVVLFVDQSRQIGYSTRVGPGEQRRTMQTVYLAGAPLWDRALETGTDLLVDEVAADATTFRGVAAEEVVVARVRGSDGPAGVILAANRMGDVSHFDEEDVKLLSALADQLAVSLENGRLEDSLQEVTRLKERLEAEVKSKDQFVASVSHELRTPLTAIVGLSGEMMANPDAFTPEEQTEIMGLIASQSSELAHIIEDLLVGARADMGTLTFKCDLIRVADEVKMAMQGSVPAELPPNLNGVTVFADPLRLRQIVRNLLTNAARYGGDRVWLRVHNRDYSVDIDVCDNGAGVPEDRQDAIFEAYERAHDSTGQPGSVGLGLSVARKLARLMGGDLRYLRNGDTTVFRLTLPKEDPSR